MTFTWSVRGEGIYIESWVVSVFIDLFIYIYIYIYLLCNVRRCIHYLFFFQSTYWFKVIQSNLYDFVWTVWSEYFSYCELLTHFHARHLGALAGPGSVGVSPQINKHIITSDYSPSNSAGGDSIKGRIIHSSCRSLQRPWPRVESRGRRYYPLRQPPLWRWGITIWLTATLQRNKNNAFKGTVQACATLHCVTDWPACRLSPRLPCGNRVGPPPHPRW